MIPRKPGSINHPRVYNVKDKYPFVYNKKEYDNLLEAMQDVGINYMKELSASQISQHPYLQYLQNTYDIHRDPHFYKDAYVDKPAKDLVIVQKPSYIKVVQYLPPIEQN